MEVVGREWRGEDSESKELQSLCIIPREAGSSVVDQVKEIGGMGKQVGNMVYQQQDARLGSHFAILQRRQICALVEANSVAREIDSGGYDFRISV